MGSTSFEDFLDEKFDFGVIRNTLAFVSDFGRYKGDAFEKWIEDLIEKKTGKRDEDIRFESILISDSNVFCGG